MKEVKKGVYFDLETRNVYEVIGLTKNVDTLEELVLYRLVNTANCGGITLFVESQESFLEKTAHESPKLRFVHLYESTNSSDQI